LNTLKEISGAATGLGDGQIAALVMERPIDEVTDNPNFFRHGLKKRLELRHKLKQKNIACSLRKMLECN
jgi:hypothetical protein